MADVARVERPTNNDSRSGSQSLGHKLVSETYDFFSHAASTVKSAGSAVVDGANSLGHEAGQLATSAANGISQVGHEIGSAVANGAAGAAHEVAQVAGAASQQIGRYGSSAVHELQKFDLAPKSLADTPQWLLDHNPANPANLIRTMDKEAELMGDVAGKVTAKIDKALPDTGPLSYLHKPVELVGAAVKLTSIAEQGALNEALQQPIESLTQLANHLVVQPLNDGVNSAVRAITGHDLGNYQLPTVHLVDDVHNDMGTAGTIAEYTGRAIGFVGSLVAGEGAVTAGLKGLSMIPKVERALEVGSELPGVARAAGALSKSQTVAHAAGAAAKGALVTPLVTPTNDSNFFEGKAIQAVEGAVGFGAQATIAAAGLKALTKVAAKFNLKGVEKALGVAPAGESSQPLTEGGPRAKTSAPPPVSESAPRPVSESAPRPVSESAPPPVSESAPPPVSESAPRPVSDSAPRPVSESAPRPVSESAPRPVSESAPQPVSESAPQPVSESAPPPVSESAPAPVSESAPLPVSESAPRPVSESAPRPVSESAPRPVSESAPRPVSESAPGPGAGDAQPSSGEVARPAVDAGTEYPVQQGSLSDAQFEELTRDLKAWQDPEKAYSHYHEALPGSTMKLPEIKGAPTDMGNGMIHMSGAGGEDIFVDMNRNTTLIVDAREGITSTYHEGRLEKQVIGLANGKKQVAEFTAVPKEQVVSPRTDEDMKAEIMTDARYRDARISGEQIPVPEKSLSKADYDNLIEQTAAKHINKEIERMIAEGKDPLSGDGRQMAFANGRTGSGKSKLLKGFINGAEPVFKLQSDEIKELFSDDMWQGGAGALALRKASSDANDLAFKWLTEGRKADSLIPHDIPPNRSFVMEGTTAGDSTMNWMIDDLGPKLEKAGYSRQFFGMEVPPVEAAWRALQRFHQDGRIVNLAHTATSTDGDTQRVFAKLMSREGAGTFDSMDFHHNGGAQPVRLIKVRVEDQ